MREEQIQRLESWENDLNNRIAALDSQLDSVPPKLRETFSDELKLLRKQRSEADKRLAELRLEKAESWREEDLQAGIVNIFDDIGRRLDRMFTQVPRH